jgi:hypothetical protein
MERLADVMPNLANELKDALFDMGEYKLARSIDKLPVVERCRCGNDDCGTFYTMEKEKWKDKHLRHLVPGCDDIYEVDVYDGTIVCIEILDRDDVSETLRKLLP